MNEVKPEEPSPWNLPNALTVLRIAGVPLFGWILLNHGGEDTTWRVWAFVTFALLMVTDRIDGDIARARGLVTNFGKIADPIADKALTGMAFIGLAIIFNTWWFWAVVIVILVREWGITLMRFVVIKYGVMPASQGGRIKTSLQALAIGGLILPFELWDGWWATALHVGALVLLFAALAVTLVTALWYIRDAIALRRAHQAGGAA